MKYNLVIADLHMFNDNFKYHMSYIDEEKKLIEVFPCFNGFNKDDITKILCYSLSKNHQDNKCVLYSIDSITRDNNKIILNLIKNKEVAVTCKDVKRNCYRTICRLGLKGNDYYVLPLNDEDFNKICFPSIEDSRVKNILEKLDDYRANSNWLEMINIFGDLSEFETEYEYFWNDYKLLDNYLVFPLSHLVSIGNKYDVRNKYLKYFEKFIERVLYLFPNKIDTLMVYAYYYYCIYMDLKNGGHVEDYKKAYDFYKKILELNPDHIKSIYRFAKLNQLYVEKNRFSKDIDKLSIYENILPNYINIINMYGTKLSKDDQIKNKYEYQASLYNIISFQQNTFLNYERAFYDHKIYGIDISKMLTKEKLSDLEQILEFGNQLMSSLNISLDTPANEMVKEKKVNQIDVFYRVALTYQYKGYFNYLLNKDGYREYFKVSNDYIKLAFKIYHERTKRNIHSASVKYLYKVQSTNKYILGENKVALESLMKGKSDSYYRAAELLYIDGDYEQAKEILGLIESDDKLNMFNKACKLREKIDNV